MKQFTHMDWEYLLAVLVIMMLLLLLVTTFTFASGCLSIDVPPQAVLSVHDGDTFTVFSVQPGGVVKVRVQGIDTPELARKKGDLDEPGAVDAREFTRQWLSVGTFTLNGCGKATLDRTVWTVTRNGHNLAHDLMTAGFSKKTP